MDTDVTTITIGGEVSKRLGSIVGPFAEGMLQNMFFDKAFLGASGYSLAGGINTPDPREAAKKRLESHRHVCDECKDSPCETAEKLSKKVHELKESYTVPTPRAVIRRHRRFGETNRYAHAIAGRATEMWAVVDTDANRIVKKFMRAIAGTALKKDRDARTAIPFKTSWAT